MIGSEGRRGLARREMFTIGSPGSARRAGKVKDAMVRATIRGVAAGLVVSLLAAVPAAGAPLHGNGMIAFDRHRAGQLGHLRQAPGQGQPGGAADDERAPTTSRRRSRRTAPHRLHERPPRQLRHLHDRTAPAATCAGSRANPGKDAFPSWSPDGRTPGLRQQPHRRLGDLHHERERVRAPGAGDAPRRRRQPARSGRRTAIASHSTRPATATTRSASCRPGAGRSPCSRAARPGTCSRPGRRTGRGSRSPATARARSTSGRSPWGHARSTG